ncbi:MAG: hypothetical protein AAF654_14880 [Myxococcota bacterium]
MNPYVLAIALELCAAGPDAKAPPPIRADKESEASKALPTKEAKKPPKKPPSRRDEEMMLKNREFLRMLEMLIDLPLLAEDAELESETKK